MKKLVLGVPVLALALGSTTACATKKFVRGEVGQVNEKVDTLTRSVEARNRVDRRRGGRTGKALYVSKRSVRSRRPLKIEGRESFSRPAVLITAAGLRGEKPLADRST
jgi:hypothetical protein